MLRRIHTILCCVLVTISAMAQEIPVSLEYVQLYDFLDELATQQVIDINSGVRPFTRRHIAQMLVQASEKNTLLNHRQQKDLQFYRNEFALECDTMVNNLVQYTDHQTFNLSLADPQFSYSSANKNFKMRLRPILGMQVYGNKKGAIIKRWWGAEMQMDIAKHVSIWGSLRDISWNGKAGLKDAYYHSNSAKAEGAKIVRGEYLTDMRGAQYKGATYGGDFSDSRGGLLAYTTWGSVGIQRENVQWGDAYHCSNILSGRNPAVPMITLHLKPCKWFEFNYFHAWLVSNVLDSTYYYVEDGKVHYRPHNKFMAANMFSFTPIHHLNLSFGNSIVYAERNVQAAYFIPFAFFKSLDHLLTEGARTQNQNSQLFFTLSTRNLRHLHLYTSVYIDEIKWNRFSSSNDEHNPISYLVGFNWSGFPLKGLSLKGEFVRSNIGCYNQSIPTLTWQSNGYNMGHYMGDNAQNIYTELAYKVIRGLSLKISYNLDAKYNSYKYLRSNLSTILAQKAYKTMLFRNDIIAFNTIYEVFPNMYFTFNLSYNHARGYDHISSSIEGEQTGTADYFLTKWAPIFYHGKNFTTNISFTFSY